MLGSSTIDQIGKTVFIIQFLTVANTMGTQNFWNLVIWRDINSVYNPHFMRSCLSLKAVRIEEHRIGTLILIISIINGNNKINDNKIMY